MATWEIFKREVWTQRITVEADTLAEAVKIAASVEEDDDEDAFEYSHTMDTDTWTAYGPDGQFYDGVGRYTSMYKIKE